MTGEQFLADVSEHQIKILRDDGVYRHIRFAAKENAWNLWFEILTWPNALTISGDMGAWTFSRVQDMFTFFRQPTLRINEGYWAEKILSESRFGGPCIKFHPELFEQRVIASLDGYCLSETKKAAIIEALDEEGIFRDDLELDIRRSLDRFEYEGFHFSDTWELTGEAYTYHFLWCLYAIVWAIQQYDAVAAQPEQDTTQHSVPGANTLPPVKHSGNSLCRLREGESL